MYFCPEVDPLYRPYISDTKLSSGSYINLTVFCFVWYISGDGFRATFLGNFELADPNLQYVINIGPNPTFMQFNVYTIDVTKHLSA